MKKIFLIIVILLLIAFLCGWTLGRNGRTQRNAPVVESTLWKCDDDKQYPLSAYAQANIEVAKQVRSALKESGYTETDLSIYAIPWESNCYKVVWVQEKPDIHLPGDTEAHFLDGLQDLLHSLALAEGSNVSNKQIHGTVSPAAHVR